MRLSLDGSNKAEVNVCVWPWPNWGDKPKPIDGNWSAWSAWSSCQIPSDGNLLPFRHKERDCTNPRPKNDGADCIGEAKRTSGCDDCSIPLGMESGRIHDSFVTALDSHDDFPASSARLNGKSAWCSDYPDSLLEPLYLQIDLKRITTISAIATQGFYPPVELMSLRMGRVSKYQLKYSMDGVSWQLYRNRDNATILPGNKKRNGTVLNVLTPEITARFLRVYPSSYFSFVCMRLEVYGCSFGCGGALAQEPGNIVTEGIPTEDQDCLWSVILPNTSIIHFDFINFNIPCSNGLVEFRDGGMPYGIASVLVEYCGYDGSLPPPVSSNSGKLWTRYKSNSSDPQVGFYAVYFPGCGEQLQGSSGDVKSPNFPREYFHNSKCIWTISVPEGKSVKLLFVDFKVEGDRNRQRCPHDHLTIWNGTDLNATIIGKFCNSNPPPPVICSSGNTLRLRFRSDDAIAWTGFHIRYQAVDPSAHCSEMSSSVVMPTSSQLPTFHMALTHTPQLTTQHWLFHASSYLAEITPTFISLSTSMALNGTFSFSGTTMNGEMQAAARGKQDDEDDNDGLLTVVVLSVLSLLVVCMILASMVPCARRHIEKRRREKEMNMVFAASLSIPETNSKETFEVADNNTLQVPEIVMCEGSSYEEILPPADIAESVPLCETPTVEETNDKIDTVESKVSSKVGSGTKQFEDGLNDIGDEQTEFEDKSSLDLDGAETEVDCLKMSYEDLGSSFASEMQAMLSHFVESDDQPARNAKPSANPENSPQDCDHETGMTNRNGMEAKDIDNRSNPSSDEAPSSSSISNQEEERQSLLNGDSAADEDEIWEMQPIDVDSPSRRKTVSEDGISVSCKDSKDSGCASSSENLHSVDRYLNTGDIETSV
ncbi:Tolloid-like protein 2 [Stylophora pistillata]|uniref:Tolloid-like protein 2 n=1 Tax=Stylophora pistillata TaxID=50429 RepID=A0A2B4RB85_STYPI|nr:Tolloid-like protein 2 [Stylophora pistillata]